MVSCEQLFPTREKKVFWFTTKRQFSTESKIPLKESISAIQNLIFCYSIACKFFQPAIIAKTVQIWTSSTASCSIKACI